ncbi:hypothetical protein CEXT_660041 [Caerostris extrusa]|uniref:Uncharacterized protein n=1 Tax=Caerostris extrusa TaxID=172846 RepID=A0AAV4M354_CAEEX|nr:hypothetical protein CEXT_660041 [Caerostris extrusa]
MHCPFINSSVTASQPVRAILLIMAGRRHTITTGEITRHTIKNLHGLMPGAKRRGFLFRKSHLPKCVLINLHRALTPVVRSRVIPSTGMDPFFRTYLSRDIWIDGFVVCGYQVHCTCHFVYISSFEFVISKLIGSMLNKRYWRK